MDYLYTAFHTASLDGTPVLNPLWYLYPSDPATWPIDLQFFFGDSILVSPVTAENSTSVDFYLPKDRFYDFVTRQPVEGQGKNVSLTNVNFTTIPVHIRSGTILPLRVDGAMTTTELRKKDFEIVVAQNAKGEATGSLYIDDGVSLVQKTATEVQFQFTKNKLTTKGHFRFTTGVKFAIASILGVEKRPTMTMLNGKVVSSKMLQYDAVSKVVTVQLNMAMTKEFTLELF